MHARSYARALLRAASSLASAATAEPTSALASCVALARGYLWVSSALLLLAGAGAALFYVWLKKRTTGGNRSTRAIQKTHARLRCMFLWIGCVLVGGWGVVGVVLATSSDYCDLPEQKNALVTLATVVASAYVLSSSALLISAIFTSIQAMTPGQETPPALVCLRCSCCSRVFKRVLLLAPELLLAAVNFVSWNDSRQSFAAIKSSCTISSASMFFGGATLIFLLMVLMQLLSYGFSSNSMSAFLGQRRRDAPAASAGLPSLTTTATTSLPVAEATPRISRKHQRRIVFAALLLISLACIIWAVLGWLWMAHSRALSPPDAGAASTECATMSESTLRSMGVSVALLLLIGWSLLTLTLCCRLEDVVLASSEVPTVDVSLLSPKLLRSPKATALSQPAAGDHLRRASTTPGHSDVVV